MPVQKKSLIGNTIKKAQTASQEPEQNDLKANSLAAHSMKKKKGAVTIAHLRSGGPALTMRRLKKF